MEAAAPLAGGAKALARIRRDDRLGDEAWDLGRAVQGVKWGGFTRVRVFSKKLLRRRGVHFGGVLAASGVGVEGRIRGFGGWRVGVIWGVDFVGWGDWQAG